MNRPISLARAALSAPPVRRSSGPDTSAPLYVSAVEGSTRARKTGRPMRRLHLAAYYPRGTARGACPDSRSKVLKSGYNLRALSMMVLTASVAYTRNAERRRRAQDRPTPLVRQDETRFDCSDLGMAHARTRVRRLNGHHQRRASVWS